MKKTLEIVPLFLLTIPLFLVAHIERNYQNLILYKFVWKEIAWLCAVPFIISLIFLFFVRDIRKACLYALPVILVYYFFADLKDALQNWDDRSFFSSYTFLLPTATVLLAVALLLLKKFVKNYSKLYRFINSAFLLFIIAELLAIPATRLSRANRLTTGSGVFGDDYRPCNSCQQPDIYYLVFDAYTSSAVLRSEFNYDNSHLDSFLSRKGFYLVPNSSSNYNLTPFSIGSTLNADYIHSLNTSKNFYLDEYLPGISMVNKNGLIPVLRREGYQIFNHSIFEFDKSPSTIPAFDIWEMNLVYKRHDIVKKIDRDIGWKLWPKFRFGGYTKADGLRYAIERDRFFEETKNDLFQTIRSSKKSPRFVYAHMLLPHGPYTFDSIGNKINLPESRQSPESYKLAYKNQLAYANTVMRSMVDSILQYTRKPLVIILQGDHGYKYNDDAKKQLEFANLSAFYFSNRDYRLLNDSISNVNTFRIVFNSFFKKNYPILKDASYFLRYK